MKPEIIFITIVTLILTGLMSAVLAINMMVPDIPESVRILVIGFVGMSLVLIFGLAAIMSWIAGVKIKAPFSDFSEKAPNNTPELTESEWSRYAEISDWVENEEIAPTKPKFELNGAFPRARGLTR